MRGGAGIGRELSPCARHGHGAVAGQPVPPVLIAGLQRAFDEQAAKARAVDEQLPLDPAAILQRHMADMAGFAVQRHIANLALDPHHPALFGIAAQEPGVEPRVEVVGIVKGGKDIALFRRRRGELAPLRRCPGHAQVLQLRCLAPCSRGEPVLMERQEIEIAAIGAERVEIAVPLATPVDELNAQLERALRCRDKVVFGNAQRFVESADRRDRRLAHADRADLVAFDQGDGAAGADRIGQGRSGHPPGSAAADDHDLVDGLVVHGILGCSLCSRFQSSPRRDQAILRNRLQFNSADARHPAP